MRSDYTRTGVRRSGDDYQDIVALELLVEMLENPLRYQWIQVEADEAEYLDDMLALRDDGTIVARQVKFSAHPNDNSDPYSWDTLLAERTSRTGKPLPSLIAKWAQGMSQLARAYSSIDASLISNRKPDATIKAALLPNGLIDIDRIPEGGDKGKIFGQFASESEAREFFSRFRFDLAAPELATFEEALFRRFSRLGGDLSGWKNLKDELRHWVRQRNSPLPDGRITVSDVRRAALWQVLVSLPEAFTIPDDFVVPSRTFHADTQNGLATQSHGCMVVSGSPGTGKSTYLSYLFRELTSEGVPTIRHHFFLSVTDTTPLRADHRRVALSLMSSLQGLPQSEKFLPTRNPEPELLGEWLTICANHFATQGRKIVVILDGLDHVWKDMGSISELDRLFDLIGPSRLGLFIILGTQPVDRSQLPHRLSAMAPRDTWRDLPSFDYLAVRQWTELHAEDLGLLKDDHNLSHRLDDLAGALWRKSEGHPLYLRYILKQLREQGSFITAYQIERLPEIPHRDIERYYKSLWEALPEESRHILILFAICDFPWSRSAIAACLDPSHQNLGIDTAISKMVHLTVEEPLGLRFSHSSIQFFIQGRQEYHDYSDRIRVLALTWLRTQAPAYVKWAYEWLLGADAGDHDPLLNGPTRAWLIESMARGYPMDLAQRILAHSAWFALRTGQLARFVQIALLSDYLANAADYRDHNVDRLLAIQLLTAEDDLLVARVRGQVDSLSATEVVALAEYCSKRDFGETVTRCFQRLNESLRMGRTNNEDQIKYIRDVLNVAALTEGVKPSLVVSYLSKIRPHIGRSEGQSTACLFRDYAVALRVNSRAEAFREVLIRTRRWPIEARQPVISQFVLLAIEERIAPGDALATQDDGHPLVVIWNHIAKAGRPSKAVDFPNPWVLNLKEYEHYRYRDPIEDFLWRTFFACAASHLVGNTAPCSELVASVLDLGWVGKFIERCDHVAREFASSLASGVPVSYGWVFDKFGDIVAPDFSDRIGHEFSVAARRMLLRLSFDLLSLQTGLRRPTISAADFEISRKAKLFRLQLWLDTAIAQGRSWLSDECLEAVLVSVEKELKEIIDTFDSRAELCIAAATIATQHGAMDSAKRWIRYACSNIIAYGYHKDVLWDQCLAAVAHVQRAGFSAQAQQLVLEIGPALADVGDYTDGDETRQLPVTFGSLISDVNFEWLARYHRWLCDRGDYYDAQSVFALVVRKADFSNQLLAAVAETAIDDESIDHLTKRAQSGDKVAARCLNEDIWPFGLARDPDRTREPTSSLAQNLSLQENRPPSPKKEDFPPERLIEYVDALSQAGIYGAEDAVDEWSKFWSEQRAKSDVLQALENFDRRRAAVVGNWNSRFQLTLDVHGINAAYNVLVQAHQDRSGWNGYFYRIEEARYRWTKLLELYPDRWLDFLQRTLAVDPYRTKGSGVSAHSKISRLVEYLFFVNQPILALEVATKAVAATVELVPLTLSRPAWIIQGEAGE